MTQRAVVLLSGGLDAATTLAVARAQGFESYALSFRYGQRHAVEMTVRPRVRGLIAALDPAWSARLGDDHVVALDALDAA